MNELSFTMTNDTISVIHEGKNNLVRKGAPNFATLRQALVDGDWQAASERLTPARAIADWAKGRFSVDGDVIRFDGEAVPYELNNRIAQMVAEGKEPVSIMKFWERLQNNPSWRSVQQLYKFLSHAGIPLTLNGTFLAYKSVTGDYKDHYTKTIDNTIGTVVEMERNKISDDPNQACHFGLHVGALNYASTFGEGGRRVLVVEVDPADVVCVPFDCNSEKMRVCKYKVVGHHGGQLLPSTSDESQLPILGEEDDIFIFDEGEIEIDPPVLLDEKPKNKVPYRYKKLNSLSTGELLEKSMEVLRDFATNGLKIVGASKIPGGKVALIAAIENVRS